MTSDSFPILGKLFCKIGEHGHTYLERRGGLMHYVCSRCGEAVHVVSRTPDEHKRVQQQAKVKPLRARVVTTPSAAERARAVEAVTPFLRAK